MKKKSLLIIPMLAPIVAAKASTLPDDINYAPYKAAYEQLSAAANQAEQNLSYAQITLQEATENAESYRVSIASLEATIEHAVQEINGLSIDRSNTLASIAINNENFEENKTKIRRTRRRLESAQADLDREYKKVKPYFDKIEVANKEIKKLEKEAAKAKKNLEKFKRENRAPLKALTELESKSISTENSLKSERQDLKKTNASIKVFSEKLESNEKTKALAMATKAEEEAKLTPIKEQLATVQAQLEAHGPNNRSRDREWRTQLRALKNKQNILNNQKKTVEKTIAEAINEISDAEKSISSTNKTLKTLRASKKSKQGKIAELETSLAETNGLIVAKKEEVKPILASIEQKEKAIDQVNKTIEDEEKKIKDINKDLRKEGRDYYAAQDRVNNSSANLERLQQFKRDLNQENRALTAQLSDIDHEIAVQNSNMVSSNLQRERLLDSLEFAETTVANETSNVQFYKAELEVAESNRDIKYEEYTSRYNLYNQKLADAKEMGANQADVAISMATTDANIYVTQQADSIGSIQGNKLAKAQAEYWASIRSEIQGYQDGYTQGYASETDEAQGKIDGEKAGQRAAKVHAETILKPSYFNQFFAEKLGAETPEMASATTVKSIVESTVEAQAEFYNQIVNGISPVSYAEIEKSNEIKTNLDSLIRNFARNLSAAESEAQSLSNANSAYSLDKVPYGTANCSYVYAQVSEFMSACKAAYTSAFKKNYETEHYETFAAQFTNLYNQKVEEVRTNVIANLYDTNSDEFYPIAEDSGIAQGKADIYEKAFGHSKTDAYNAALPAERSQALSDASIEVDSYIQNNASLTVLGSDLIETDLMGGSDAKIALKLKNISPKDLVNPVRVKITRAQNADFQSREFYINQAKGDSITEFKGIDLSISQRARSGSDIIIEGEVILNGGKYQAQRVETFKVVAKAATNPSVAQNINFDSTPDIQRRIFWSTTIYSHNITVKTTPEFDNIPEGYTIKLTPQGEHADLVKMKTSHQMMTGAMSMGRETETVFTYQLDKSAEDKEIPMLIEFIFKGKVLKSKTITIKPH